MTSLNVNFQKNHKDHWISTSFASSIIDYLESNGYTSQPVLDELGLSREDFRKRDSRINAATYNRLFEHAHSLTRDPRLGLHSGQLIRPGHYGVLGYIMMSCETFGEALMRAKKYHCLVGDLGHAEVQVETDTAQIRWHPNYSTPNPQVVEHNIAAIVTYARWISNSDVAPLEICFTHEPPPDLHEHEAFYRCSIKFNQPHTCITLPLALTKMKLPQTDPAMKQMMDRYADNLLEKYSSEGGFIRQVKAYLNTSLLETVPSVEDVAKHFNLTVRTLQRRLRHEGFSYKQLLDETRKDLAIEYVKDGAIHLPELAFLLGFSEQSSFQRAFKRWTGLPPGQYRRRAQLDSAYA